MTGVLLLFWCPGTWRSPEETQGQAQGATLGIETFLALLGWGLRKLQAATRKPGETKACQ